MSLLDDIKRRREEFARSQQAAKRLKDAAKNPRTSSGAPKPAQPAAAEPAAVEPIDVGATEPSAVEPSAVEPAAITSEPVAAEFEVTEPVGAVESVEAKESAETTETAAVDAAVAEDAPKPEPTVHEKVEGWEVAPEPLAAVAPAAAATAEISAEQIAPVATPVALKPPARPAKKKPVAKVKAKAKPKSKAPRPPRSGRPRIDIISGFKDPLRRPRFLVWSAVGILALAAVMIVALGVTSTYWFCANGCHKVQDDTIIAYNRSSHSEISCMACHMPVGADPVTFIIHKAEALGELYLTATGNYELPLNKTSHVALTMDSSQCTQCHDTAKRPVTPSEGVLIDHVVHAEKGVSCTICHNRVAHVEDFDPVGLDPKTGEKITEKHVEFGSMTACFRCHTHDEARTPEELKAPGDCDACHPKGFELKPASHLKKDFFPKGHAKLGEAAARRVEKATIEAEKEEIRKKREHSSAKPKGGFVEPAYASGGGEHSIGEELLPVDLINECFTCHAERFCSDCHGLPMPHPANFLEGHGELGEKKGQVCSNCHGAVDRFCDGCHHGSAMDREYDFSQTWISQHYVVSKDLGTSTCLSCHKPTYCAKCHVSGAVK